MKSPAPVASELLNAMQDWNSSLLLLGMLWARMLLWTPESFRKTVNHIKLNSSQAVLAGEKGFPENV